MWTKLNIISKTSEPLRPNVAYYISKHFLNSGPLNAPAAPVTEAAVKNDIRPISEMPGPKAYPLVGNVLDFVTNKDFRQKKLHYFWMGMFKEYGPIFRMMIPGDPRTVLISDPNDIEKFHRITMENPVRDGFQSLRQVRMEAVDNYFEGKGGLLIENGEEWWRVRSRIQTPMMKPKNLTRYIESMDGVTLDFMERIASLQKEFGEMPPDFQQEIYKWSLESIGLVALNRRLGCLDPNLSPDSSQMKLISTVNKIFEYLNTTELGFQWWRYFPSPTFRKLREGHNLFLRIADQYISETEKELEKKKAEGIEEEVSLLETLLQREGLTRKDVVTFILDMLFAGIDTTSQTVGFTLYLLARNKSAQGRLQEEVDSVLGDGKGPITDVHLAKLSYLKDCIKESLRIFPLVFGSLRIMTEDTVFSGYLVPKGDQVFAANIICQKDASLFPRPNEFLPERWGKDHPYGPIHPFASLPFSHGTRMCIGRRVAEQEIYIFIARVMHRFNIDYKYQDMDMFSRLASTPSEPLRFEFTERK